MTDSTPSTASLKGGGLATLRWLHWQRLAERWWRRWGYALSGVVVGGLLVWLARPHIEDEHQQAAHALAQQRQQMAALPELPNAKNENRPNAAALADLESLPDASQKDQLWPSTYRALTAHGLRVKSMRHAQTTPASGGVSGLTSQPLSLRLEGRFADWMRFWQACADTGPLCSLDRLAVVALPEPGQVQVDVQLRLWMRAADPQAVDATTEPLARPVFELAGDKAGATQPQVSAGVSLFASDPVVTAPALLATAEARSAGVALSDALPADPRHWPLARLRWLGMWQQGQERRAYLSAGTHWTPVVLGQRVTLEGHRVVDIAQDGVRLRLGQAAPVLLTGEPRAVIEHKQKVGR
jgi:Tfp pilus assembly protein PilO